MQSREEEATSDERKAIRGGTRCPLRFSLIARRFSNVVHFLLEVPRLVGLVDELLEAQLVQHVVGGRGELFVEQADGELAGRGVGGHGAGFLEGQSPFEAAEQVADADLARGAGEAVTTTAADLALE